MGEKPENGRSFMRFPVAAKISQAALSGKAASRHSVLGSFHGTGRNLCCKTQQILHFALHSCELAAAKPLRRGR